jgi:hypothetical protein
MHALADIIDLDRYPLEDLDSPLRAEAVGAARIRLREEGCAVLPDLLRIDGRRRLSAEARANKHLTHYSHISINPYFSQPDPALPDDHPVNTFGERSGGFIPGDAWAEGSPTEAVYRWQPLLGFLAECLEIDELHCYADPLACLTVNVLDPGQQFAWHYDTNDFAVTLLLDESRSGGLFQYVPNIRAAGAEPFDEVADVLADQSGRVKTLELHPGDLQIFRGRHSLHRVTRVPADAEPRLAAIFAYTEQPNVIGRIERTKQLFGRVLAEHVAADRAERADRADDLLD